MRTIVVALLLVLAIPTAMGVVDCLDSHNARACILSRVDHMIGVGN